jgi:hypothetical protein
MTASLPIPFGIDALSDTELRDFVPCLLEDHARLATENAALRAKVGNRGKTPGTPPPPCAWPHRICLWSLTVKGPL